MKHNCPKCRFPDTYATAVFYEIINNQMKETDSSRYKCPSCKHIFEIRKNEKQNRHRVVVS